MRSSSDALSSGRLAIGRRWHMRQPTPPASPSTGKATRSRPPFTSRPRIRNFSTSRSRFAPPSHPSGQRRRCSMVPRDERDRTCARDPAAERNWALMAKNPNMEGTTVDAPLEWLAFRALPLLPTFPEGRRVTTSCVTGRTAESRVTWPLWSEGATIGTVRSLLQMDWARGVPDRRLRGVFAVCTSRIRRSGQGFGNFGPATIVP